MDKDRIIGCEFHYALPANKKYATSIINKNLENYRGLGIFIKYEQAKRLLREGFEKINVSEPGKKGEKRFKQRMGGFEVECTYHYTYAVKPEKMYSFTNRMFDLFLHLKPNENIAKY